MTVREFLTKYNLENNWPVEDEALIESMVEVGEIVHRSGRDTHRWYICETVVRKIGDTFIKYTDYLLTGDACMSDMDLHYDIDKAEIVERKEREITEVYYELIK